MFLMDFILTALKYLKKYPVLSWGILISILITSLLEGVSFVMIAPLIQSMTAYSSEAMERIPSISMLGVSFSALSQSSAISLIFLSIFFVTLTKNIFLYASNVLIAKLRFGMIRDLRFNLVNNLLEYDLRFFDSVKTGHILANINNETERMGNFMLAVLQFISLVGRVFIYVILLFMISLKMSIIVFLVMAVVLIPIELIMKKIKKIGLQTSKSIADYSYKLSELITGIRLIKASGTEDLEKINFRPSIEAVYHFSYLSNKNIYMIIPLSEVFISGIIVASLLVFSNFIKVDFSRSFAFIATYLLVMAKMLTQLNALNTQRSQAMSNLGAFASYDKMCDKTDKVTIVGGSKEIVTLSDSIKFNAVDFSYVDGQKVLRNINIRIPGGKVTALVGASGSGKSTILNLILRFYDVESGDVLIDGASIRDFNIQKWRKKVGFVSQDIFIFNASVKDNISYGYDGFSEEDIREAAIAANAHSFIMELPEKYNTILGERGIKLSGGQKQRISISRAIIHNPEILILDEATSSLDTETERSISQAIDRLAKGRTVIAIAHRLSTILHAENIIVLEAGEVVESGRHIDLMKKNGLYKRLYDAQFRI